MIGCVGTMIIYNSRNSIVFIDLLLKKHLTGIPTIKDTEYIYNSRNSIVFIDPKGLLKTSQS